MPALSTYDYAVIRVVPRVEREEFVNVGVIVSCEATSFLEARIELDEARVLALDPAIDLAAVRAHLETHSAICRGGPRSGPDRRAAAARAVPLAHGEAQRDHPDLAGARRAVRGAVRYRGAPARADGAEAGMKRAATHASLALVRRPLLVGCAAAPTPAHDVVAPDEVRSLDGRTLIATALPDELRLDHESKLAAALADHARAPSADTLIWVGRRLAYLGRYREAIAPLHRRRGWYPRDARFLRHRGHRYLTTRQIDGAMRDFEAAAVLIARSEDEIEPDGLPNARGIPTSTLHTNVYYHLGLAHYLRGNDNRQRAMPGWSASPHRAIPTWKRRRATGSTSRSGASGSTTTRRGISRRSTRTGTSSRTTRTTVSS